MDEDELPDGDAMNRRAFLAAGGGLAALAALPAETRFAEGPGSGLAPETERHWQSEPVRWTPTGKLIYRRDPEGNRVPDFSYAGYHNGHRPIPDVPTVRTVGPIAGGNTAHIQAALDEVGGLAKDPSGFRGALLLLPGDYPVAGTLRMNRDGVVLRGSGDGPGAASNTVIRGTATTNLAPPVLIAGGADTWGPGVTKWAGEVPGTRTLITSELVRVGESSFTVDNPDALAVGDNVILFHPSTAEWLAAVDQGATHGGKPWKVGADPILYNRYVQRISGERVTVDGPIFNHLRRDLSQSYVYRWDQAGLVREVGVENLRIDIQYTGDPDSDENHAGGGIALSLVEDAWVRNCTTLHFWFSGVRTTETTRATIENCQALDPVSRIAGSRRYNFAAGPYSQQILFKDCFATNGRHNFVVFGRSKTSGIVFYRNRSEGSYTGSEGHAGWSQGLLFDNHLDTAPHDSADYTVFLGCRGNFGGNHGWASVHSVAWRSTAGAPGRIVVQKPPTAQNYAIGCFGDVSGNGPFTEPAGYIEGSNETGLIPQSLYAAQLADRLGR